MYCGEDLQSDLKLNRDMNKPYFGIIRRTTVGYLNQRSHQLYFEIRSLFFLSMILPIILNWNFFIRNEREELDYLSLQKCNYLPYAHALQISILLLTDLTMGIN
ncbi:unnamed protein product [Coccothraustes coccothraustes]